MFSSELELFSIGIINKFLKTMTSLIMDIIQNLKKNKKLKF
jgi:hypothetical protein